MSVYSVTRWNGPINIDAQWEKDPWARVSPLRLEHHMGNIPKHFPAVEAKLAYDETRIYLIFRVNDRYVCARKESFQERVCEDSCVEFFFTPGDDISDGYFNLEVNCGGTALFHHQKGRGIADTAITRLDFRQVSIAHSLPKKIDPEIAEPVTWAVEYSLPVSILANYAPVSQPEPGVIWRANLYKCADGSSHPHWLTWALVEAPSPDFHRPECFGRLVFE
jgi:hypothetical protein